MVRKIAILGLILLLFLASPASATWWNYSFSNAAFGTPISGAGVFNVTMNNGTGTHTNTTIFCDGCLSNVYSIRLVADNVSIPQFNETVDTVNQTVVIWGNKTNSSSQVLGVYWNNPSATSVSNGTTTFTCWEGYRSSTYKSTCTFPAGDITYKVRGQLTSEGASGQIYWGFNDTQELGNGESVAIDKIQTASYNRACGTHLGASNCGNNGIDYTTAGTTKNMTIVASTITTKGYFDTTNFGTSTKIPTGTLSMFMWLVAPTTGFQNYSFVYNNPALVTGTWGATQTPFDIISWSNNYTNNENLSISVPQSTNIKFNITSNMISTYNWTVNGINQNQNTDNFALTASSLNGYTIIGSAYNSSASSTVSKTWMVSVTASPYTGGEGQTTNDTIFMLGNGANITVLALQNFTQIILFNSSETPQNTLQFLINGSRIRFNSSTDKTISNISYYPTLINGSRGWNFTLNSGTGNMNVSANVTYPFMNYSIYNGSVWVSKTTSNSTGWLSYVVSGTGNYSIQRDLGKPYLISPTNQSTQTITTLPYSQSFVWSNEGSAQYNIQVAQDLGFSIIETNTNLADTQTSIGMWTIGTHYWRVRTYDGISTYGEWSEPFSFTLTGSGLPSSDGSTGIQGIVYETRISGNIVLSNAIVQLSNLTHSFQTTTDANGYYLFKNLSNNSDYLIQATKKNYIDGSILPIQTGNGTWIIQNIYLTACVSSYTCNVNQQFVKFTVQTLFGTKYPNVAATVYKSGETTESDSAITDDTGAVNFWLVKDQKYRLTFINATSGINRDITIVASDTEYLIIISGTGSAWQEHPTQRKDAIYTNVTKSIINNTHAYINTTYLDLLNETIALTIYINQTNAGDPYNQTIIQSWTATAPMNNTNHSFIVTPYSGRQYIVHYVFTHTTYGTHTYLSVSFTKDIIPSGISSRLLLWFSIIFMVMTGAVFTASTAELGLIIVAVEGWIFLALGFLKDLNTTQVEIGLTVTTVLGVIAYITMKNKKEGYS